MVAQYSQTPGKCGGRRARLRTLAIAIVLLSIVAVGIFWNEFVPCVFVFCYAGLLCVFNFYLVFLRYPIHRLRGRSKADFRFVSVVPVLPSLLVAVTMLSLYLLEQRWLMIVGAILIAVDTGGIHWAIMSVLYEGVFKRDCSKTDASPS